MCDYQDGCCGSDLRPPALQRSQVSLRTSCKGQGQVHVAPGGSALDVIRLSLHPDDDATAPLERDLMFHVRMAAEERRMLAALAEDEGISASDWVRMVIRRSFKERLGESRPKKKG